MHDNNRVTTNIDKAVAKLRAGGLVAFPTETVYGLGADATNPEAIQRVFAAKGRPTDHPVIVHIADPSDMTRWAVDIPEIAWSLAQHFWPGPLTLILKKQKHVSPLITGGQDTIGIRMPKHPLTQELLKQFNGAIVGPSANKYGKVSPTSAMHVDSDLADLDVVILDGGSCDVGIESTIVDVTGNAPIVMRKGTITAEAIADVLNTKVITKSDVKTEVRTPGSHEAHYAPSTPALLLDSDLLLVKLDELINQEIKVSVMSFLPRPQMLNADIFWQHVNSDPFMYAHDLYANLRNLDQLNKQLILIEKPPTEEKWSAVLDRLKRACAK